ncbi:unnamed protein product [Paramecium octaurelia]|uniref:Uncharacterized protein n=1 Tax=Paramecium octaurelia TaxID=43137 RepID=A0A8S1SEV9_PAROT|nr:unnamed protein product [Paramecium octaurelia]
MNFNLPQSQSQQQQNKIVDQLALECSLFNLTKKCFVICSQKIKNHYNINSLFEIEENKREKMIEQFDNCIDSCSFEYAQFRTQVRKQFVDDMTKVNDKNDQVYNSFYK